MSRPVPQVVMVKHPRRSGVLGLGAGLLFLSFVSKFSERVQIYKADDGPAVVPGFYSARADIATAGQEPEGQECTKRAGRRLDRLDAIHPRFNV